MHHGKVRRGPRRTAVMDEPGHVLMEWATDLERALKPHPEVKLVLSTSWVHALGFDRAKSYLPTALQARVVGATFHRREHGPTRELRRLWAEGGRGAQIAWDVSRRKPRKWFAVDDAVDEFLPGQLQNLVRCESSVGLSEPRAQRDLSAMLESLREPTSST
ncbi:MAG: hypothetical protein H6933_10985 [Burkholderiaceae bacterium]|nr:hypothetical protein [Burkholderiaceae bacterium]